MSDSKPPGPTLRGRRGGGDAKPFARLSPQLAKAVESPPGTVRSPPSGGVEAVEKAALRFLKQGERQLFRFETGCTSLTLCAPSQAESLRSSLLQRGRWHR